MASGGSTFTAPVSIQGQNNFPVFEGTTTPGADQTLFSENVPATLTATLYAVYVDCRSDGRCTIYHETTLIGSFRVGPSSPTGNYVWYLPYEIPSGDLFEVKFRAVSGVQPTDLAAFVQITQK